MNKNISINRIMAPGMDMEKFFRLASDCGVGKVELRNDLPGGRIIDDLSPGEVRVLAGRYGIRIIAINALQHFNLPESVAGNMKILEEMAALAAGTGCPAIVLCPHNEWSDARSCEQMYEDTVASLKACEPVFKKYSIIGYVEALGFRQSSLRSIITAQKAIFDSAAECYRLLLDTFHHYLGTDDRETLKRDLDLSLLGLVHISGIDNPELADEEINDSHRGMVVPERDILDSAGQVRVLLDLGYTGDISFEPFSPQVQNLEYKDLLEVLREGISAVFRY